MTKKIRSYDDLVKEREKLELLLQAQKEVIHYDIQEIKEELQPVRNIFEFIKKITTRDKTSLLINLGSEIAINSLIKRFILQKAGWAVRTIVPFFLKNYSSHFFTEQKDKWIEKLKHWLSRSNGKEHTAEEKEEKTE